MHCSQTQPLIDQIEYAQCWRLANERQAMMQPVKITGVQLRLS